MKIIVRTGKIVIRQMDTDTFHVERVCADCQRLQKRLDDVEKFQTTQVYAGLLLSVAIMVLWVTGWWIR